jgi:hypothetical protein
VLEAYRIGVEIVLKNSMSSALAVISRDLLGIHTKVGKIEKGIGKWGLAITGVAGVLAGTGILKGLAEIAKHGEELLHQQDVMVRAQGKAVGVQEAHRRAVELTADAYKKILPSIPTATASDVLRTANEMYQVTGSYESAKEAIPKSLMLEALVGNATGKDAALREDGRPCMDAGKRTRALWRNSIRDFRNGRVSCRHWNVKGLQHAAGFASLEQTGIRRVKPTRPYRSVENHGR